VVIGLEGASVAGVEGGTHVVTCRCHFLSSIADSAWFEPSESWSIPAESG
jgi:hypothetical protein